MKCPKCPNVLFRDELGPYCLCGYRPPIEPSPDALEGGNRPATHAHKTLAKYEELKREDRRRHH